MRRKVKGIWIPIEVWEMSVPGMHPIHRCIYAEIDSLSKPGNPCRASNGYLARFFKVSLSTISRTVSWLHERKLIRVWYKGAGNQLRCMEVVDPSQSDMGASQIDKAPSQSDKAPSQNDIHRIPLEYHLEHPEYISDKKTNQVADDGGLENPDRKTSPQVAPRPPSTRNGKTGKGNPKTGNRKVARRFEETAYWDYAVFEAGYVGSEYETVDLRYYHEKLKAWSMEGHIRKDWLAAGKMFMLNDRRDGRLVTKNHKSKNNGSKIIDLEQARRIARFGKDRRD